MKSLGRRASRAISSSVRRLRKVVTGSNALPTELRHVSSECSAAWYDDKYASSTEYRVHYTQSVYYSSWCVVADRLLFRKLDPVLDIGCGSGQFAALLRDRGTQNYLGLDFCGEAIRLARNACPEFDFLEANALESDALRSQAYKTVVSLEFLEHVERDLEVLGQVRAGTFFIGTVPNFPSASHVRYFDSCDAVRNRYQALFVDFRVDQHLLSENGRCLYLMQGIRKSEGVDS